MLRNHIQWNKYTEQSFEQTLILHCTLSHISIRLLHYIFHFSFFSLTLFSQCVSFCFLYLQEFNTCIFKNTCRSIYVFPNHEQIVHNGYVLLLLFLYSQYIRKPLQYNEYSRYDALKFLPAHTTFILFCVRFHFSTWTLLLPL